MKVQSVYLTDITFPSLNCEFNHYGCCLYSSVPESIASCQVVATINFLDKIAQTFSSSKIKWFIQDVQIPLFPTFQHFLLFFSKCWTKTPILILFDFFQIKSPTFCYDYASYVLLDYILITNIPLFLLLD